MKNLNCQHVKSFEDYVILLSQTEEYMTRIVLELNKSTHGERAWRVLRAFTQSVRKSLLSQDFYGTGAKKKQSTM